MKGKGHIYHIILVVLFTLVSVATFAQKKVRSKLLQKNYSEERAKEYFIHNEIDDIEGIWQSSDGYKYSISKYVKNGVVSENNFTIIVFSSSSNSSFWKENYVRGYITKTSEEGVYKISFYSDGKNFFNNKPNIDILSCSGTLENYYFFTFTPKEGHQIKLTKIFPTIDGQNPWDYSSLNLKIKQGTGFAISSNGYIVTNYHVVKDAKYIDVKGVNGDFSKKMTAEVVVSDFRNDIAIIKITDPSFKTLGDIPYSFRNSLADVGEDVFVLGYPMTNSMGQEVKLTNGLISSKTGFLGDVSSYQVSVPIYSGNSGAPLFDKNANVLGIINAKHLNAESASYAIKVNYLNNLLELLPNRLDILSSKTLDGISLTDQTKMVSDFIYIIMINDKENFQNSNIPHTKQTALSEENAMVYFFKAKELYEKNDFKGALEQINLCIEASPSHVGAYFFRGLLYYKEIRNYDLALEDLTKTIQLQPDFISAYFYRALAFKKMKRNVDAIKDFSEAIKLNNDHTDSYFMRALIKSEMGDLLGAIDDYDEIIKREDTAKPEFYIMATVYNNKGYSLLRLNRLDEAIIYINKALKMASNESYIWGSRGEYYFKKEDYSKCIKDMQTSIEVSSKSLASNSKPGQSYYLMGLSKIYLGKILEGCKDLSKAGELGIEDAYKAISENCQE
jgi:S1-C subfamily serine protease